MSPAVSALRAEPDDFEWFNTWWDDTRAATNRAAGAIIAPAAGAAFAPARTAGHALAMATRAALVARDVAEIEQVRDRLFAVGGHFVRLKGVEAPRVSKTTGPVVLGSVLGILVVAMSSVAAAFVKFAR